MLYNTFFNFFSTKICKASKNVLTLHRKTKDNFSFDP